MEVSHGLKRYIRRATVGPIKRLPVLVSTPTRNFTSCTYKHAERPPQPKTVSNSQNIRDEVGLDPDQATHQDAATPGTQQTRAKVYPQSTERVQQPLRPPPQPHRPRKDSDRIDLSSIPGINQNRYEPPKPQRRLPDPESASAKLNALFAAQKQQQQQQSEQSSPSSERPLGSLDIYTTARPRPAPFTGSQEEMKSLLGDLMSPSSSKSAGVASSTLSSSARKSAFSSFLDFDIPTKLALRLHPTLGRSQRVDAATGMDLTRAFRTLEVRCNSNRIKQDMNAQRFHVRRGQKRKLDRSRRWRAVFKEGFKAEVGRVRRMMKQGW